MVLGLRCSTGDKVFTMFWGVGFDVFGGKVFNHVLGVLGFEVFGGKVFMMFWGAVSEVFGGKVLRRFGGRVYV